MNKIIIMLILGVVVLLIGTVFLASSMANPAKEEQSENAVAMVDEKSFDWGEIKIDGGIVEKAFKVENKGEDVLKLYNVVTSCACTTAQITKDGQSSPIFGMHNKSDYVMEVGPGESAEVLAKYDPLFHGPSGVGPISRTVTVQTNDPNNPEINWMLTAMVVR